MAESSANPTVETEAVSDPSEDISVEESGRTTPSLRFLLLRDAALVFALLTLWGAGDAWSQTSGLAIAGFVALGNAVFIGLALAAIFHEWGHYAGTVASGGANELVQPKGLSLFRFQFDFDENDRRQFHWMTYGGWIGQWLVIIGLAILLPLDTANRVALVSAAFAFAVFAHVIEVPVIMDSRSGTDPQEALKANVDQSAFTRATIIGGITGLFVFALIT